MAFPLLQDEQSINNDVHVSVSFQTSPVIVNLDKVSINRLIAIVNAIVTAKKPIYDNNILNYLSQTPSAGFFTYSSTSVFGNHTKEKQDDIYSIFEDYITDVPTTTTPLSPSTTGIEATILPLVNTNALDSLSLSRHDSFATADYHSIISEGQESFHSLHEENTMGLEYVEDDFQSIHESTSKYSSKEEDDEFDSASLVSDESPLSMSNDLHRSNHLHPVPNPRRRNSVFSITSATHSLTPHQHRRNRDTFTSIGRNEDYQTVVESEIMDASSISTFSSKKRRMNLNVSCYHIKYSYSSSLCSMFYQLTSPCSSWTTFTLIIGPSNQSYSLSISLLLLTLSR